MKGFIVNCELYVEDDDADGALATAKTILEDAHGSESVDSRDDYTTFGFALGAVLEREPLDAIRNVVNYNWSDELADYLAHGSRDAPSHHIFRDLQRIVSWLDSRTGGPRQLDDGLKRTIREALEGDSNDSEHDALAEVAEHFGIGYDPDLAS